MKSPLIVDVAVDQPLDKSFSYLVPESMAGRAEPGMRVLVPFGRRKVTGYILGPAEITGIEGMKEIEAWLDPAPLFGPPMLEFFRWISAYYLAPLGEVIRTGLPSGINSSSFRVVRRSTLSIDPDTINQKDKELLSLIPEGSELPLREIEKRAGRSGLSLLYRLSKKGIVELDTKVEIGRVRTKKEKWITVAQFKQADGGQAGKRGEEIIDHLMSEGEMPQKALIDAMGTTSQTLARLESKGFIKMFEKEVYRDPYLLPVRAVGPPLLTDHQQTAMEKISAALEKGEYSPFLLEGLTGSGKTEIYLRTIEQAGGCGLVLIPEISLTPQLSARFRERFGDRVAVLHSGLSDGERYDQWRRIREGSFDIVVGARSAIFAPLKEVKVIVVDEEHETSYKQEEGVKYNARDLALVRGKMEKAVVILGSATPSLESRENVSEGKLEQLSLPERVSARPLPAVEVVDMRKQKKGWISPRMSELIGECLEKKEQVLLFLNRRGFAPSILCRDCGHYFKCPHCSVTLTWHQREESLRCHYCNYRIRALPLCPVCNSDNVSGIGIGTERLEAEIRERFPDAGVARMDRDTVRKRGAVEEILNSFGRGDFDILIGTQMVAKGHHFPDVTLVGVLMADLSLNVPDFRAAERTFQLLTQVAGRAGRGDLPGRVLIQTFSPEHYAILHGGEDMRMTFYDKEREIRMEFDYPPFSRLLNLKMEGRREEHVIRCAGFLKQSARKLAGQEKGANIEILGPAAAPLSRVKGCHRWLMLVKCRDSGILHRFARKLLSEMARKGATPAGVRIIPDIDPCHLL